MFIEYGPNRNLQAEPDVQAFENYHVKNISDMLTTVAAARADRPALVEHGTTITYATLETKASALAQQLHHLGIRPGHRVGLLLRTSSAFVIGYFGSVRAGAIVVPLNDHYQQNELLYFIEECQISVLLTSPEFYELCQSVLPLSQKPPHLLVTEDWSNEAPDRLAVTIDPDAPLMYQYSSGSTGKPKRIARTHAKLLFELDSLTATLGITPEDRFIGVAPFSHVNGLTRSMLASLRAGAALYPVARYERQAVADLIEQNRITVFIAVPFMFSTLAQTNFRRPPDFSSLRLCVSASAPMLPKFNRLFYEKFGRYVRQLYGSTETGAISVNLSDDIANSLESVGLPIRGVAVDVLTETGQLAPANELGEFAVKSPAAITRYDNLEEANKEAFRDGYFLTGDLGRKDEQGRLTLIGRKKFFINKGGFKIDPREVEALIEAHSAVAEVVVVGIPTTYGDEKVKAVIVLNGNCTEEAIVEHCRGKIADFKIPSVIEFRDSLPKSENGKILRGQRKQDP